MIDTTIIDMFAKRDDIAKTKELIGWTDKDVADVLASAEIGGRA